MPIAFSKMVPTATPPSGFIAAGSGARAVLFIGPAKDGRRPALYGYRTSVKGKPWRFSNSTVQIDPATVHATEDKARAEFRAERAARMAREG